MLIYEQKEPIVFTHYLTGTLIFLLFANWCDWHTTSLLLLGGAFCGALPDWLSLLWGQAKINKWSHKHRDNVTHSLVFPVSIFILVSLFNTKLAVVLGLTLLSHPILDIYGLGWGVKLFAPFSDMTVKIGHIKGKWFYTQKEIDTEAEKHGDENWVRNLIFKPTWIALSEWGSLILTIGTIIYMGVR